MHPSFRLFVPLFDTLGVVSSPDSSSIHMRPGTIYFALLLTIVLVFMQTTFWSFLTLFYIIFYSD